MALLKTVWKIAVGVKDILVLLFLLLLFAGIWAAFNMRAPLATVPDGAALVLEMEGVLVDVPAEPMPLDFLAGASSLPEIEVRRVVDAIDAAADDASIKMIVMNLNGFVGGGQANLATLGDALARFRAKGKRVDSWATAYVDDGYYLAAHSDQAWMSPMGAVLIAGPGGTGLFFKEALDKLKVTVEVFRVGTYKSAVEPFILDRRSPEARQASQALIDDLWQSWRAGVERQRPKLDVAALVESWPARVAGANRDQAELAMDAGLVDRLGSELDFLTAVAQTVGVGDEEDRPGSFNGIDWQDYLDARAPGRPSGPAVGIVHVQGNIVDGEAPMGVAAGGTSIAALIDEAVANDDIKAIVLRVDSGGGSATASEVIRDALMQARKRGKPVVASFGPVAASGGYWVAMGADAILAQPETITGSIGVFGVIPTFERTLDDLGISGDPIGTTPLSGQPDIIGGLNAPARALIQGSVVDIYGRFVRLVAESRKLPVAEVEQIAEGRVWSGRQALDRKLIDGFGNLDAAIARAAQLAEIEGEPRVVRMRGEVPFLARILSDLDIRAASRGSATVDAMGRQLLASRARAAGQVLTAVQMATGPAVQVRCVACAVHAPVRAVPAVPTAGQGWIATLLAGAG